jgi:hypothetical protein
MFALLDWIATVTPPIPAALPNVTVQVDGAPAKTYTFTGRLSKSIATRGHPAARYYDAPTRAKSGSARRGSCPFEPIAPLSSQCTE